MATTLETIMNFELSSTETLDTAVAPYGIDREQRHSQFNVKATLNASSTPAVSFLSSQTLTGASGTIDLTSLPTTEGTRDATGLKLKIIRINNKSTTTQFDIHAGASNGYVIGGDPINVEAGGCAMHYFKDVLAAVGASTKTLDWTLTASHTADITLIFGPA